MLGYAFDVSSAGSGWFMSPNKRSLQKLVSVPHRVQVLNWWKDPDNVCVGVPCIQLSPAITIMKAATLVGWGAHLGIRTIQGEWSAQEA